MLREGSWGTDQPHSCILFPEFRMQYYILTPSRKASRLGASLASLFHRAWATEENAVFVSSFWHLKNQKWKVFFGNHKISTGGSMPVSWVCQCMYILYILIMFISLSFRANDLSGNFKVSILPNLFCYIKSKCGIMFANLLFVEQNGHLQMK